MKINVEHRGKIKQALEEAERGCKARLFDMEHINRMIEEGEKKLKEMHIPKYAWDGCQIKYIPKVPNSYRGIPLATWVVIERFSSGWFVTVIERAQTDNRSGGRSPEYHMKLTYDAKMSIPNKMKISLT